MSGEVLDHFFVGILGNTDFMLGDELKFGSSVEFFEFALGSATNGAFFGCFGAFVNIAADHTDKFLFHYTFLVL